MPVHHVIGRRPARHGGHRHAIRTHVDRPQRLPPVVRRACRSPAFLQPRLFPVRVHRRRKGNAADDGTHVAQPAIAFALQPRKRREPRMDGNVPRRGPRKRLNARALPLQRDGVGGRGGGTSHGGQRHRGAARADGMHAEAQHR